MTKRELKQEIDQLRNDMAAEFVKRDKDIIESRTEGIKTRNAFDNALATLEKRLKNTEEFVGIQTDAIAALILACGLREEDKFNKAYEQIKQERADLKKIIDQAKADKPASQIALKPESDLFSEPAEEDVWIDSKEACRALGWKSISTTMLRKAGIRYRQPLGKHRKITAHKGDIENYVRNRRNGRK